MQTAYIGLEQTLKHKDFSKLMIHSDQGIHYTHPLYIKNSKNLVLRRVCQEKEIAWIMHRLRVSSDT